MKRIILASQSPRRKMLLENINLDFEIHPSNFDELEEHENPEELAIYNAVGKAQSLQRKYDNSLIIGVDTVVAYKDHILGKPKDTQDARRILRLLSKTTHKVISAICILDTKNEKLLTDVVTTFVTMDRLDEKVIDAYIESGEGVDKAAGYAIQGIGSLFISKIEGDYFNVVGLPINKLRKMLKKFRVEVLTNKK